MPDSERAVSKNDYDPWICRPWSRSPVRGSRANFGERWRARGRSFADV